MINWADLKEVNQDRLLGQCIGPKGLLAIRRKVDVAYASAEQAVSGRGRSSLDRARPQLRKRDGCGRQTDSAQAVDEPGGVPAAAHRIGGVCAVGNKNSPQHALVARSFDGSPP